MGGIQHAVPPLDSYQVLARVNGGRAAFSEINASLGELNGYQQALNSGQIGIRGPGNASVQGPDYVTLDTTGEGTVNVWDAKYRGPKYSSYPTSIDPDKLQAWMPQVVDAVNAMPEGPAKSMAIDALANGRVAGLVFKWPK
jgi:hypothetical protein